MRYLLAILLLVSAAQAADVVCGTDSSAVGAFAKITTVAYPQWTSSGCSAGEVRQCQANGTFTGCVALSAFTCNGAGGSTYWVDDAETDCSGAGTYLDPEDYRCWFDTGMSGYHAPVAGDCIVFRGGSYTTTHGTSRMVYLLNRDGTSSDRIILRNAPGEEPSIVSPGTAIPIELNSSDYADAIGFVVPANSAGNTNNGILVDSSSNNLIAQNYVHDVDGSEGSNPGGIKLAGPTNNIRIWRNWVKNNYDRAATQTQCAQINLGANEPSFQSNTLIDKNYIEVSGTAIKIYGIRNKFIATTDTYYLQNSAIIENNTFDGMTSQAIATNAPYNTIRNNIFINTDEGIMFGNSNQNSPGVAIGESVTHNTFSGLGGAAVILTTDATTTMDTLTFRNNIVVANRAVSWSGNDTGLVRLWHYATDPQFNHMVPSRLSFGNNCWWNAGVAGMSWDVSASGTGATGGHYASLAAWQSATSGDAGSYSTATPNLDASYLPQNSNCTDKGYSPTFTGGIASHAVSRANNIFNFAN